MSPDYVSESGCRTVIVMSMSNGELSIRTTRTYFRWMFDANREDAQLINITFVRPWERNKTQFLQSMLDKKELMVDIVERPSAGYNTTRTPRKIIITASQFIFHTEQHCTIRSRPRNICLLGSTFHHCTAIILLYVSYRILTSILSKVYIFTYIVLVVIDTSTMI